MDIKEKRPLYKLKEIAEILRSENGCAWDKEQTSKTLRPYMIEEAYEVYDAIDNNDPQHLKEELGDLFYQVYAHSQIASETNQFDVDEVAEAVCKKLIFRHPHVFGDEVAKTPQDVIDRWEQLKMEEKAHRESILDGVPNHSPALLKAYRVQEKVARVGFDWEKFDDIFTKLDEEINEFKEAVNQKNKEKIADEAGDILFSMVNVLRYIKINPEESLNGTTKKFVSRFKFIEKEVSKLGKKIEDMTLKELNLLWDKSKTTEK